MCEYCENKKEVRSITFNGDTSICIFENELYVDGDIVFKISHCPMCRKEAGRVIFQTKKELRKDIEKLEKEKKQLIEKRETNYNLYKAIIAIMLQENRKCIEIDLRAILASDDYELAFCNNPFKITKEIKLVRRNHNANTTN